MNYDDDDDQERLKKKKNILRISHFKVQEKKLLEISGGNYQYKVESIACLIL